MSYRETIYALWEHFVFLSKLMPVVLGKKWMCCSHTAVLYFRNQWLWEGFTCGDEQARVSFQCDVLAKRAAQGCEHSTQLLQLWSRSRSREMTSSSGCGIGRFSTGILLPVETPPALETFLRGDREWNIKSLRRRWILKKSFSVSWLNINQLLKKKIFCQTDCEQSVFYSAGRISVHFLSVFKCLDWGTQRTSAVGQIMYWSGLGLEWRYTNCSSLLM